VKDKNYESSPLLLNYGMIKLNFLLNFFNNLCYLILKSFVWPNKDMENQDLHSCEVCNSPVTDSVSLKVENDNIIKLGKYNNGNWICDDCFLKQNNIKSESIDYSKEGTEQSLGVASSKDVSPNTPPA
jgi:hypothetical protein